MKITSDDRNIEKYQGRVSYAYFGGGCFWCTEAVYERIDGVVAVTSGYAGGTTDEPTYEEVSTGRTGHAEVVRIAFDPDKVTFRELVDRFWHSHDPTTLNRQGYDVGTQYRSIILYTDDAQKQSAEESRARAQAEFSDTIVTTIEPLEAFWPAEEYHQDYFEKNPYAGYCQAVIRPKLEKLDLGIRKVALPGRKKSDE